jgi:hypothetical protein
MKIPFEYDPYSIMMRLFLIEAAEMQADEILLVSREGRSNLYFVAGNRVQRLVKLRSDIAPDLAQLLADKSRMVEAIAKTVRIRVMTDDTANAPTVSTRKPSADVDSTIRMPSL